MAKLEIKSVMRQFFDEGMLAVHASLQPGETVYDKYFDDKFEYFYAMKYGNAKKADRLDRKCIFTNSPISDIVDFRREMRKTKEFETVDLDYYYNEIADWSKGGGKMKLDWSATARNWIRRAIVSGHVKRSNKMVL